MALLLDTEFSGYADGTSIELANSPDYWQPFSNGAESSYTIGSDANGKFLRMRLGGGVAGSYRTEMTLRNPGYLSGGNGDFTEGMTRYFGYTFRIQSSSNYGTNGQTVIMEWAQATDVGQVLSAPLQLSIRNGQYVIYMAYSDLSPPVDNDDRILGGRFYAGAVIPGAIENFEVKVTYHHTAGSGHVQVWRNETLIVDEARLPTRYDRNDATYWSYFKWGIYTAAWSTASYAPAGSAIVNDVYSVRVGEALVDVQRDAVSGISYLV